MPSPSPDLKSRLIHCAEAWAAASDAPLSRLGKIVAGDANFFERVMGGGGVNVATLEKFARFLAEPTNWPDGAVPEMAIAFAQVTGVAAGSESAAA